MMSPVVTGLEAPSALVTAQRPFPNRTSPVAPAAPRSDAGCT